MNWQKITHTEFHMDERGYHVDLTIDKKFYPTWTIVKDGVIIDSAIKHHPVTSDCNKELAAKAQIEKILILLP